MATKKDIKDLKASISEMNTAINDIRDHVIQTLLSENIKLQTRVKQLEIDLAHNQQYHRRSNIVISGIPKEVEDLESSVIGILNSIEVPVRKNSIEAVHRIGKEKELSIVRFISRRDAEAALANQARS